MLFTIVLTAVNAIAPLVLLILLGYFLKCRGFLSKEFLKIGKWLVFHLTLPATLFVNVYRLSSIGDVNWPILFYCMVMVFVLFLLGMGYSMAVTREWRYRGVIWQSTFRSNFAILGVAIAAALGGSEAETLAAVASSIVSALYSVLAVISMSVFSESERRESFGSVVKRIVGNPLIIGGVMGFACLIIREIQRALFGEVVFALNVQLKPVYTMLENLKSITTPFSLLVLGGQFEYKAMKELYKEITATAAFRLVIAPVIGLGTALLLNRSGILSCGVSEFPTLVALFCSPVSVGGAIMATQMGGDEQLSTQIVVWTSLLSVGSILFFVSLLMWLGVLAV